jgi:hypothetical protein
LSNEHTVALPQLLSTLPHGLRLKQLRSSIDHSYCPFKLNDRQSTFWLYFT